MTTYSPPISGADQPWVVPVGVTSIDIDALGAGGASSVTNGVPGGTGGRAQCTIAVTPGETLTLRRGRTGSSGLTPGMSGGNPGGWPGGGKGAGSAGGGGGYTGVFRGATPLCIAGGGGGSSPNASRPGGDGGGTSGSNGGAGTNTTPATGGSQSSGGIAGTGPSGTGTAGDSLLGGDGYQGSNSVNIAPGGGGGGYFGGGGAGSGGTSTGQQSSGGGGSSFTSGTSQVNTPGAGSPSSTDGTLTLTYNLPPSVPTVTAPNGGELINTSTIITHTAGVDPEGGAVTYDINYSTDNGASWVSLLSGVSGTSHPWDTSVVPSSTACLIEVRARDAGGATSAYDQSNAVFTIQHNVAPLAPTPITPPDGSVIDRTATQRFSAVFNDLDGGDSSSKIEVRYRPAAGGAWVTVSNVTTSRYYDFVANTFANGDWEWQVRYYDAANEVGPWSASRFFTAATPPVAAAITNPINGSTVGTSSGTIDWSTGLAQQSYQVRKLADSAGVPADPSVPANVYYDSGEVVSTTARNAPLTFPTNTRFEHLQVRIKVDGLWSQWSSVRVEVSYTPPATPILAVAEQVSAVDIVIVNPTPTGTQPATTSNEVWVNEGDGEKRYAVDVPPNTTWRFAVPRSGDTVMVRVKAKGANGVDAWSA